MTKPAEFRKCRMCREIKPASAFRKMKRSPSQICTACKCLRKKWDNVVARSKTYKITVIELQDMGQFCKICGKHSSQTVRSLHVDHCHDTGRVRGVLCNNCNIGLGNFRHDRELLKKAIQYLENE